MKSDDGKEFLEGTFGVLSRKFNITQEFTSASSPQFNGLAERALGLIEAAGLSARIQALILFPIVELPSSDYLWTEATSWAYHCLNCSATTSNPDGISPHELWHRSPPQRKIAAILQAGLLQSQANEQVVAKSARVLLSRPRTNPPPGFCESLDREQLGYQGS